MDKSSLKIGFSLTGEKGTYEQITSSLGILPDMQWNKGDSVPGRSTPRKWTFWEISTEESDSRIVDDQLKKMYELLKNKIVQIKQLKREYGFQPTISIVVKIENEETPDLHFYHWFIDFIHEIEAEVDIDTYVYS